MEFLVSMTTHVPAGTRDEAVAEIRSREAANSAVLAERGGLLRLWRPPLEPGEWRTLGLFSAADTEELEATLASMPLRIWRHDDVTPLAQHPNDPAVDQRGPRGSLPEFFTTFTIATPALARAEAVDAVARESVRAAELASQGSLARLWSLPARTGLKQALSLWRAVDQPHLEAILASLPMAGLMVVETIPLSVHPSDPAAVASQ